MLSHNELWPKWVQLATPFIGRQWSVKVEARKKRFNLFLVKGKIAQYYSDKITPFQQHIKIT